MKVTKRKKLKVRTKKGIFKIELQTWDKEPGYVVRVPALPEIITEGSNIKKAKAMAREAIEFCIDCEEDEHHTHTKSKRSTSAVVTPGL